MTKGKVLPCHPKLDSILESYFSLEGTSIKSILSMTAKGTTSPIALTRRDVGAEVFDLFLGLTPGELEDVCSYYVWREIIDRLSRTIARGRKEYRRLGKSRRFKTGISEVERRWNEKNER
jgi:hypothetical protein